MAAVKRRWCNCTSHGRSCAQTLFSPSKVSTLNKSVTRYHPTPFSQQLPSNPQRRHTNRHSTTSSSCRRRIPTPIESPTSLDLQPIARLLTQTRTNTARTLLTQARHCGDRRASIRRTNSNALGATNQRIRTARNIALAARISAGAGSCIGVSRGDVGKGVEGVGYR